MAFLSFLYVFFALCILTLWKRFSRTLRDRVPPGLQKLPGPKGLPIIGSVHQVPEKLGWIKFADWGKEYGPIYQVNLAGTNHVWISSDQIANDLLLKKGAIYSDRPHIPALIDDNRTSAQYLPLLSKNDAWKRQRKFTNTIMRDSEKANFHRYPELEAIRMLVELMDDPSRYNHALESFIARVTCRLAWGAPASEASDELKQRARELLIGVSPTGALGNKLPFLMSLPDWLSPAKAWERRRAKTERKFFQIMQGDVQSKLNEKRADPSWMRLYLENRGSFGFANDLEGAYAVGMHGIAGALTIAAPMQAFCLAMCHYPKYLSMLHEELDSVCGDRMPTNADKPNLPFLRAVIRECLRWRPPVPTGIPHCLVQDDVYNGYHIPAGSVMHPLEWSISRDPALYPDPETFNPLRWLKPGYPTYKEPLSQYPTILNSSQFGYGRRTCQGQTVAEADLIAGIGAIAWLFDIKRHANEGHNLVSVSPPPKCHDESTRTITSNDKMTIPINALDTGLSVSSSDSDHVASSGALLCPGAYPAPDPQEVCKDGITASKVPAAGQTKEEDPTLVFTTLLIAKPLPFSFDLRVREGHMQRAEWVRQEFDAQKAKGEFRESKHYWGPEEGKGQELGWGKV